MKNKTLNALLILTVLSAGCEDDLFRPCIRGNNNVDTETRSLSGFNSVDILIEGDVEIRKSAHYEVVIEGNTNQIDDLTTRVTGGKLKIYSERCFNNTAFNFIIYTPELMEVKLSGAGDVLVRNDFHSDEMNFYLSGSGKINGGPISASKVKTRISGSGSIYLEGDCNVLEADISGSGTIHAFSLLSNTTNGNISGSGNMDVFTTIALNANISGSGTIRYKGTANVNSNISGSGRVIKVQ